jgi:cytochrome c oxidase assembly protein subunit 15
MVLALLILALLIVLYVETSPGKRVNATFRMGNTMRYALTALLILSLVQVFLGTQVRQQIDVLTNTLGRDQRGLWIESLNWIFKVHRSFSIILLLLTGWIFYQVNRYMSHYWVVYRMTWFLAIFIGIETLTGVIMAYLGMPWWAQPVHMLVSSMIIGSLVYLLSSVHSKREIGAA